MYYIYQFIISPWTIFTTTTSNLFAAFSTRPIIFTNRNGRGLCLDETNRELSGLHGVCQKQTMVVAVLYCGDVFLQQRQMSHSQSCQALWIEFKTEQSWHEICWRLLKTWDWCRSSPSGRTTTLTCLETHYGLAALQKIIGKAFIFQLWRSVSFHLTYRDNVMFVCCIL